MELSPCISKRPVKSTSSTTKFLGFVTSEAGRNLLSSLTMAEDKPQEEPWWAPFPAVQSSPNRIEASQVKELLEADERAGPSSSREFLLVDVRRTDFEGGTIKTSINLPAHSLYQTRPVIYQLCKQAGIKQIIFYCGKLRGCIRTELTMSKQRTGSSNGRGPRSAGWMQDYLNEIGDANLEAIILTGGIKGWVKAYKGDLMDWYDEKAWA